MERMRKPFQGVWNIIRFNWQFYLLSFALILLIILLPNYLNDAFHFYSNILCWLIIGTTFISLLISFYVYDLSDLYKLNWLNELESEGKSKILNINAGFDETSVLLKNKYRDSELIVWDFYNPLKHTAVSIKRARKAYPPYPNTQQVNTTNFPLANDYVDEIFVILSAHEIRNESERGVFFKELKRILKPGGKVFVTEHLRDIPNFLAYNIGFFHFHSKTSWSKTFQKANLKIYKELKITSFITTFILQKNGDAS